MTDPPNLFIFVFVIFKASTFKNLYYNNIHFKYNIHEEIRFYIVFES